MACALSKHPTDVATWTNPNLILYAPLPEVRDISETFIQESLWSLHCGFPGLRFGNLKKPIPEVYSKCSRLIVIDADKTMSREHFEIHSRDHYGLIRKIAIQSKYPPCFARMAWSPAGDGTLKVEVFTQFSSQQFTIRAARFDAPPTRCRMRMRSLRSRPGPGCPFCFRERRRDHLFRGSALRLRIGYLSLYSAQ